MKKKSSIVPQFNMEYSINCMNLSNDIVQVANRIDLDHIISSGVYVNEKFVSNIGLEIPERLMNINHRNKSMYL